jgi:vancomycin resistance protein YoaR
MEALPDSANRRRRILVAVGIGLLGLLGLILMYHLAFAEKVYPGVRVGSVDVGGLAREEAAERLRAAGVAPEGQLTLRDPDDGRTWQRAAAELGLLAAEDALADAAYERGRDGNPLVRWLGPLVFPLTRPTVPAAAGFDAERARGVLEQLAQEVDVAPQNAGVREEGGRLVAVPARLGHQLDISGTLHALALLAADPLSDTLDVALQHTTARVPDLANVADAYNMIVSAPVQVGWREGAHFEVPVDLLKKWVTVSELANAAGDTVPTLVIDRPAVGAWLEERRAQIDRPPENARFGFDDSAAFTVIHPGQTGRRLDAEASVDAVIETAYNDVRVGELVVRETPATVPAGAVNQLADVVELTRSSTALGLVQPRRLAQLTAASARLNGSAVPAGGYFSFVEALGPVTEAAGFDPVLSAQGQLDGAISQACTTLLRTAWWAGLPILERHAPLLRQGWVEAPVGLDCAVGAGQDLRLLHDGTGYLVFETRIDAPRGLFTVVLYGRPRSRQVDTVGPRVTNITAPGPARTLGAPGLQPGEREQLRWAREGADVSLERSVLDGTRLVARDRWTSHYAPSGDITLVGR